MASDFYEDEENCPNCGHFTGGDGTCPNCGAILKPDDDFVGFQEEDSTIDDEL